MAKANQAPETAKPEQTVLGRIAQWVKDNHAQQPSLGAQLTAMTREAMKDVNNTVHEVFFGKGVGYGEPGTPLNPTPQIVTGQLTGEGVARDMGGMPQFGKITPDDLRAAGQAAQAQQAPQQSQQVDRRRGMEM